MLHVIPATEAQERFAEILDRVACDGETIEVERDGQVQAVVLPKGEYDRLRAARASGPDWRALVRESRAIVAQEQQGRPLPDLDALIDAMRDERDAQLRGLR